jgi:MoxR-like ATPase
MFNIFVDYPTEQEEIEILRSTTQQASSKVESILSAQQIIDYQKLVRNVPVADNVLEYAVKLVQKTRVGNESAHELATKYLEWGAGPRAGQFLILGAKCHALLQGKYSPDIEDIKAIAAPVLRHRIVRNFKAEAEDISVESIIEDLF